MLPFVSQTALGEKLRTLVRDDREWSSSDSLARAYQAPNYVGILLFLPIKSGSNIPSALFSAVRGGGSKVLQEILPLVVEMRAVLEQNEVERDQFAQHPIVVTIEFVGELGPLARLTVYCCDKGYYDPSRIEDLRGKTVNDEVPKVEEASVPV